MSPCVIVGGGISGLSAAYYLTRAGIACTLLEKRRLGGVIRTEHISGCLVEGGPDSFLAAKPWAMDLIRDLGMEDQVISSNDHLRKTFIWKGGRMVPLPDGLQFLVPTKIAPMLTTPLLSWNAKLRMALDWFRKPAAPSPDVSVSQLVERHYGREMVDYLAEPLLAGVYGGRPEDLSASSVLPRLVELEARYGSLSRGVLAERSKEPGLPQPVFRTLKGGLGTLVDAVAQASASRLTVVHAEAERLERTSTGYRVRASGDWIEARQVILACEAHSSGRLASGIDPGLSRQLLAIPYSSSMILALGFDRRAFKKPPEGFGFLIPRKERQRLVACTFVGTKFSYRVPDGVVLLRCFLGGVDGEQVLRQDDAFLTQAVLEELKRMTGVVSEPLFTRIFRWPQSMAQYPVGHQKTVAEIERRLGDFPCMHLIGNAFHGIGVPDCIRLGKEAADRVIALTH